MKLLLICVSLLLAATGCGRAGGAPNPPSPENERADSSATISGENIPENPHVARLEQLRKRGQFATFVELAVDLADERDQDSALQLLKTEALAAVGRNESAEAAALDAAALAAAESDGTATGQALRLWAMARFRQAKPLDEPQFADLLATLPPDDTQATLLRFWHESLAHNTPYRLSDLADSERREMRVARAIPGSVPEELNAIEAVANGVPLALVFLDTGAQHNLMTVAAAQAAGVKFGSTATQLVGFAGLAAKPGVIERLDLGGLTLHDVPVLVGDSAPLAALNGQMALGTELMHHVRFTIDYPASRVFAERADSPRRATSDRPTWEIPLWSFSQACLAQGQLAPGVAARVLVDTGDLAGTFVSARWARRNLSGFEPAVSGIVFRYKPRNMALPSLELGSRSLVEWPVADTIPSNLERLNLVDVLVGHDLLAPYELTIDLRERVLELRGDPASAAQAPQGESARPFDSFPSED